MSIYLGEVSDKYGNREFRVACSNVLGDFMVGLQWGEGADEGTEFTIEAAQKLADLLLSAIDLVKQYTPKPESAVESSLVTAVAVAESAPVPVASSALAPVAAPSAPKSAKEAPKEFNERLNYWLALCNEMIDHHYKTDLPNLVKEDLFQYLIMEKGNRYIRIVKREQTTDHRSAWAFIDMTNGDILKPATWKAPAKHARGNIFDADPMKSMGPYGPAYLK